MEDYRWLKKKSKKKVASESEEGDWTEKRGKTGLQQQQQKKTECTLSESCKLNCYPTAFDLLLSGWKICKRAF